MPISEDEFEHRVHSSNPLAYHHYHQQQLQMAMSKAEQRKNNKPIMEKKRRARINNCLNELKSLILDAMKKDPARHSKLEKADILEMTVKHLQTVQKQQLSVAMTADPSVVHKFKSGFSECASEVNQFIGRLDGIDAGLKSRLIGHLSSCVTGLQQISPFPSYGGGGAGTTQTPLPAHGGSGGVNLGAQFLNLEDLNNNRGGGNGNDELERLQAIGGIQLIPSRLPTGEFAFVLPNSASAATNKSLDSPNLISEIMNRSHASAFTAVHHKLEPDEDEKHSLLSPSSVSSSSPVSFNENSTSIGLASSNDEVTSTSNLDQFKIPQRNFHKNLMKNKTYQTTTMKSEPLLKEVHLDYPSSNQVLVKDEDILRKYEDSKRELFTRSFLTPQKLIKPLTVITNNEERERLLSGKNPLDYSMKKTLTLSLVQPVESSQLLCDEKLGRSHYEPLIKIETRDDERTEAVARTIVQGDSPFVVHRTAVPTSILALPKDLSHSRGSNPEEPLSRKHERSFSDGEKSETTSTSTSTSTPPSKRPKLDSSEDDGDSPRPKSESSPLSSSTLSTSTLSTSILSTSSTSSSSAEKDSMWRPW